MKVKNLINKNNFFILFICFFSLLINQYYASLGAFPLDTFYHFDLTDPEPFQITKYDEKNQGFYKPHQDQQYDFADRQQTVRKLSMSIQLTSPEHYEGGQLQFPHDKDSFNVEDAMDQGTVVFFPSYIKHGVTPVTKGIRYSLVCWIHGPNFK